MVKYVLIFIVLSVAASAFAADVPGQDIAKCAVIEGALARLECYDSVAKKNKLNGPQSQPVDGKAVNSRWLADVKINPIDDSKTVTLVSEAVSGISRRGYPVYAYIRCKSNETDFFINWNDYIGGDEPAVLSRIGNAQAQTSKWDISTDNETTFHPQPIPFIKSLLASDKLILQVTPYSESPVTVIFDLTNLSESIKPVRDTCKW